MPVLLSFLLTLLQAAPVNQGIAAYTRQEDAQAREILQPLANGGEAKAQDHVGLMYQRGVGYPRNYVQAHLWFNLSASKGIALAATARDEVEKQMTQQQRAEAERLALDWRPTSGQPRAPDPPPAQVEPIRTPSRGPAAPGNEPAPGRSTSGSPPSGRDAIEAMVDYLSSQIRPEDSDHSAATIDVTDCTLTAEHEYLVRSARPITVSATVELSRVVDAHRYDSSSGGLTVSFSARSGSDVRHERSSGRERTGRFLFVTVKRGFDFDHFAQLVKAAIAACSR